MCPGRVSSSCFTSDTRRVTLVTNPVISYETITLTRFFIHCRREEIIRQLYKNMVSFHLDNISHFCHNYR
jgi:hypothetical protein